MYQSPTQSSANNSLWLGNCAIYAQLLWDANRKWCIACQLMWSDDFEWSSKSVQLFQAISNSASGYVSGLRDFDVMTYIRQISMLLRCDKFIFRDHSCIDCKSYFMWIYFAIKDLVLDESASGRPPDIVGHAMSRMHLPTFPMYVAYYNASRLKYLQSLMCWFASFFLRFLTLYLLQHSPNRSRSHSSSRSHSREKSAGSTNNRSDSPKRSRSRSQ